MLTSEQLTATQSSSSHNSVPDCSCCWCHPITYSLIVTDWTMMGVSGRSFLSHLALLMAMTTSMPEATLPNTAALVSQSVRQSINQTDWYDQGWGGWGHQATCHSSKSEGNQSTNRSERSI